VSIAETQAQKAEAALARAEAARDRGDWSAAVAAYRLCLEQDPRSFNAWFGLGRVLKEDGAWIDALVAYGRALALGGQDPALLAAMGELHAAMGHRQEAADFRWRSAQSASATPSQPAASSDWAAPSPRGVWRYWSNRKAFRLALAQGDTARDRGVWGLAAENYRRYLDFRPNNFGIRVQLGHVLKEAGRYDEAAEAYGQARRLHPHDGDLLLSLGHLCKLRGDRQAAIDFYRQSFEADRNSHARAELERMGLGPEPR
jgi:tetratricopeptide (TPR) repeat protein